MSTLELAFICSTYYVLFIPQQIEVGTGKACLMVSPWIGVRDVVLHAQCLDVIELSGISMFFIYT